MSVIDVIKCKWPEQKNSKNLRNLWASVLNYIILVSHEYNSQETGSHNLQKCGIFAVSFYELLKCCTTTTILGKTKSLYQVTLLTLLIRHACKWHTKFVYLFCL